MYLCITVTFLTDFYHGDQWPPPPSQLFQALMAGNKAGRGTAWTKEEEKALKWLEGRPPPIIIAPKARPMRHYLAYGPDNVMDIVLTGKEPRKEESEIKVPLLFKPWLVGEGKSVHYLWEIGEIEKEVLDTLREMALHLLSLGKGEDFVSGRLLLLQPEEAEGLEGEKYLPTEDSSFRLGVPYPGFLSELLEYHDRCRASRPTRGRPGELVPKQRYRKSSTLSLPPKRPFAAFLLRSPNRETLSLPWEDAILPVAWTRHALSERLRGSWENRKVDEYVLGHTKSPNRLSYLPLPSIGHPHAGGGIRRIMIVFPFVGEEEKKVRRFLPYLVLTKGEARMAILEPIGREDPVLRLYLGPHSEWATVTPVVLHGHDRRRGKFSTSKTRGLILQAFEEAGYPRSLIKEVEFRKAPFHPGTGRAEECKTPSHLSKWPKYHVRVKFAEEVEGPIVIGVGRHYGIGLFAPLP